MHVYDYVKISGKGEMLHREEGRNVLCNVYVCMYACKYVCVYVCLCMNSDKDELIFTAMCM